MGSHKIHLCKPVVVVLVRVYHGFIYHSMGSCWVGWEDIGNNVLPKRQICKHSKSNDSKLESCLLKVLIYVDISVAVVALH